MTWLWCILIRESSEAAASLSSLAVWSLEVETCEDSLSCPVPASAVLLDAWILSVSFWLVYNHKSSVLLSSTVILRTVYFTSKPFSEDSVVLPLLQSLRQYSHSSPQPPSCAKSSSVAQLYILTSVDPESSFPLMKWNLAAAGDRGQIGWQKSDQCLAGVFWSSDGNLRGLAGLAVGCCGWECPRIDEPECIMGVSWILLSSSMHHSCSRDELQDSKFKLLPPGNSSWNFFP